MKRDRVPILLFKPLNPARAGVQPLDFYLHEPMISSFKKELVVGFLSLFCEKVSVNSPPFKNN